MEISLALEYFAVVVISVFSVLQIVASVKDKNQLRIMKNKNLTLILSIVLIVLSFSWFFLSGDRNVQTYMEGAQISLAFGLGAPFSLIVTKIIKKIYEYN